MHPPAQPARLYGIGPPRACPVVECQRRRPRRFARATAAMRLRGRLRPQPCVRNPPRADRPPCSRHKSGGAEGFGAGPASTAMRLSPGDGFHAADATERLTMARRPLSLPRFVVQRERGQGGVYAVWTPQNARRPISKKNGDQRERVGGAMAAAHVRGGRVE